MVDFNKKIDRRNTFCTQWDYIEDRFGRGDLLPFTISDMDLESPKEIIDALINRVNHKVFGYSRWNHKEYKSSIVNWYKKRFDTCIKEEWIVYSPSVMYSVSKFINMWSNEGDGILINTPAYDAFYKIIESNRRKIIKSSLIKVDNEYKVDIEDFREKCKKAKIFLLCNPHNPTGRVWREEEIREMLEICEEEGVKVISDDIHMDITYKRRTTPIFKVKVSNDYVICSSPSKTFNIPALTGSYIIIPSEEERNEFLNITKNKEAVSSPSILAVIGTMVAYNECEYWVDELVKHTDRNLDYVLDFIKEENCGLELHKPDGCYFAWIDFEKTGLSSDEFRERLIEIGKVAIMPGITYGEEGEFYIRLNVGCSKEKVEEGLKRIKVSI